MFVYAARKILHVHICSARIICVDKQQKKLWKKLTDKVENFMGKTK